MSGVCVFFAFCVGFVACAACNILFWWPGEKWANPRKNHLQMETLRRPYT